MPQENPLRETTADQQFLLELEDHVDQNAASLAVQNWMQPRLKDPHTKVYELVVEIKAALGMPIEANMGATIVIMHAIEEAKKQCGFLSPEVIMMNLFERRRKLLAASTVE
ncbi:hypothetical protein JKY72_03955 [Candidatus Gracilibacteria bacterium]|nr:hypothetical protein [Candidatus Gracilibacteria bacterium]